MKRNEGRIYISGPITGTDDYMERFERVEKNLERLGYESIVNPAKTNATLPADLEHGDYMEVSLALLGLCDSIYLMEGWRESKGCCMEYGYATAAGMEIWMNGGLEKREKRGADDKEKKKDWEVEKDQESEEKEEKENKGAPDRGGQQKKKDKLDHGKIGALHKAGWSNKKIADEMQCAESTVSMVLKRFKMMEGEAKSATD